MSAFKSSFLSTKRSFTNNALLSVDLALNKPRRNDSDVCLFEGFLHCFVMARKTAQAHELFQQKGVRA